MVGGGFGLVVVAAAEEVLLAAAAVRCGGHRGLHRPIEHGEELCPAGAEGVERPGLDERFHGRAVDRAGIEPLAEIEQAAVGSAGGALAGDGAGRRGAAALDGRQPEADLALGHGELGPGAVHVRRQHGDFHPLAVFDVLDQRVFPLEVPAGDVARQAAPP